MRRRMMRFVFAPIDTKKGKMQYYMGYTALFAVTVLLVYGWYFITGRTFIWNGDGWVQHFKALAYYSQYLRSIVSELINNHQLVIPEWDFCIAEGSDVLQMLHYYGIGDPFTFFSVLIPMRFMHLYYDGMSLLKLYLAGAFFAFLCFETGRKSRYAVLAGALTYCFCFWAMFNAARHPFWLNPMMYMPLILTGVEKLFRKKRPYLLAAAVFVSAISNWYFFYMQAMITVIYVVVRLFISYRKTSEKRKEGGQIFVRIAAASVIGVLLAAVVVLPVCASIFGDARFSSKPVLHLFYPFGYYYKLLPLFFSQERDDWTCMGYAAPVLPAILLLFRRKKNELLKVLYLIGMVMLLFPVFGWALNGFSYTVNRWVWALALLSAYILTVMWPSFMEMEAGHRDGRAVAVCMAGFFAVYFILQCTVLVFTGFCLALFFVILQFVFYERDGIWRRKNRQPVAMFLVIASIGVHSFWLNSPWGEYYASQCWKAVDVFRDLTANETLAVQDVALSDQYDEFYRYSGRELTLNANILSNQYSTQYYWSLSNPYAMKYRYTMGLWREDVPVNYFGYEDRVALAALSAVRYYVLSADDLVPAPYGYDYVKNVNVDSSEMQRNEYAVYRNQYALPLGYTYDGQISSQVWDSLSAVQKQEAMLQGVVLNDYDGNAKKAELSLSSSTIEPVLQENGSGVEVQDHAFVVSVPGESVTFSFEGMADSETYFYIDGLDYEGVPDYDLGSVEIHPLKRLWNRLLWTQPQCVQLAFMTQDGNQMTKSYFTREYSSYNDQHDFVTNLGYRQEAMSSVTITFLNTGIYTFDSLGIECLQMEHFAENVQERSAETLRDVDIIGNEMMGNISLESSKLLCLAIPYSKGWSAYVDGEEATLYQANVSYMALDLDAGEHSIRLVYHTPWLRAGVGISSLTALVCLILYLVFWRRQRHNI